MNIIANTSSNNAEFLITAGLDLPQAVSVKLQVIISICLKIDMLIYILMINMVIYGIIVVKVIHVKENDFNTIQDKTDIGNMINKIQLILH